MEQIEIVSDGASWPQFALTAGAALALSACGGGGGTQPGLPPQMQSPQSAVDNFTLIGRAPLRALAAQALDPTALMDWAEAAYPQYFPSHQPNLFFAPYTYRYYPETQNYVGVADGYVYVLGTVSNYTLLRVGSMGDFSCRVDSGCTVAAASATEAARFLAQATLGANKAQVAAVQASTYSTWIDAQFAAPVSQAHYDWLVAKGYTDEAYRNNSVGLDNTIWRKLISGTDPLRQRMVLALSEICVVSVLGVATPWRQFAIGNYLDILEANAFGNYRTLLGQVTLSTAMGYYLTYRGNAKANSLGSQPDENYARELMQLFTIGLLQLQPDGTPTATETYGASDVSQLARVFTGWDLDTSGLSQPLPPDVHRRPMAQVGSRYETGSKTFLGTTIPVGTDAVTCLNTALDTLFAHPNLPPFVSRQLIQRLVTSNPSAPYVGRVAAVFANNGSGVRGDLRAVLRAILLDIEARDSVNLSSASFGKVREPVVRFLNWARGFGAVSAADGWSVGDLSNPATKLGQSPMRSGSVFNFFRPGYVPPNTPIASAALAAPELQITTESSIAGYVNFMQKAVSGSGIGDTRADYTSSLVPLATDSAALLAEINLVIAADQVSSGTLATLKTALDSINVVTDAGKLNRVHAALTLVMAAPEYIVQK
ncbi:MAG: hypothetical protein JWQ07_4296 [Ramlibacter sp.]|nr:hypothetical protein [Ramlibacter sp.]